MTKIQETLLKIGLENDEAIVYEALLNGGATTALSIARETGIKRPTVYLIFERLKSRGLLEVQLNGLKQRFAPVSPDRLEGMLTEQREQLSRVLPEMLALYTMGGEKKVFTYYEGIQSIKSLYELILRELKTGDPYYIISKQDNWYDIDAKWFEDFVERRSRRTLDTRIIFQGTGRGKFNVSLSGALKQKVKLLETESEMLSDVIITPQRYVVHSLRAPYFGVSIEHGSIISAQLEIFMALWNALPDSP